MNSEENMPIRPIHYLGSKLRMLETVKEAVDTVDSSNGCDSCRYTKLFQRAVRGINELYG